MKKNYFILLIFLLSLIPVSADRDWIYHTNSALVDVNISSEVQVIGNIKDLRVNLSMYPKQSDFQSIITQTTYPEAENFIFHWYSLSSEKVDFGVDSRIRTFEKIRPIYSKVKFPVSALPSEYDKYLESSELIDSDNPEIVSIASELAAGESDMYELVHKIGLWIKENIEYDLDPSLVFTSKSASWTLENKRAVCDEMTTLFIAMNRAVGIPARFVSGYAYTDDPRFREGWGPHAWAEVYFPSQGWVPIDVTYGQLGDVDLTHIELRKGADVTTGSAYYSWYNGEIRTEQLDINVELVSTSGTKPAPVSLRTYVFDDEIGFGSYGLFEVEIENQKNYYVPITLLVGAADIVEFIETTSTYILLEPGEAKKLYWIFKIKKNLDSKYIYTAELAAATSRTNSSTSLETSKNYDVYSLEEMLEELSQRKQDEDQILLGDVFVDCDYEDIFYVNEEQKISCHLFNQGNINFDNMRVCLDLNCKTIDLKINQKSDLIFLYTPKNKGDTDLKITLSGSDISKTEILHVKVLDKPEVNIDIQNPGSVKFNQDFEVNIDISTSDIGLSDSRIKIYRDNEPIYEKEIGELKSQSMALKMKGSQLEKGANHFRVKIEYYDSFGNKYTQTEGFEITLEKLNFWQNILHFLIHLFP